MQNVVSQKEHVPVTPGAVRGGVPAVDNAFRILAVLAAHAEGAGVSAIAREVGIAKSSCFKILMTLLAHEAATRDAANLVWRLGPRLVELGTATRRTYSRRAQLREALQQLVDESGLTCLVCQELAEHRGLVIIDRILPSVAHDDVVTLSVGTVYPLSAPVVGGIVLASHDDADVVALAGAQRICRSPADVAALIARLAVIRRRGYATSTGEFQPGFNSVGCAVPNAAGSEQFVVALIGRRQKMPARRMDELGAALLRIVAPFGAGGPPEGASPDRPRRTRPATS